jgi:hypothetical protein
LVNTIIKYSVSSRISGRDIKIGDDAVEGEQLLDPSSNSLPLLGVEHISLRGEKN